MPTSLKAPSPSTMAMATWLASAVALLAAPFAAAAQSLPYTPTTILLPKSDDVAADFAYVFAPRGDTVDLLALNISSTLDAQSLSLDTLTAGLPFIKGPNTAFTPSLADNGSIIVHAGDCASSDNAQIWTYNTPEQNSVTGWSRADSETKVTAFGTVDMGPGFLGGGLSFSVILEPEISPADMYVYGGMCPSSEADGSSEQSNATYSNQMVKISPSESVADTYNIQCVENSGPPVAEAGFTFSALTPSFSNVSGTVTQQVNYVLLGGHTRYAFVNMSTAAIWSLPEQSWGFVSDIGLAGSGSPNTELAVKSTLDNIDSRSGHSAVLSEDGTELVILGGWVGDFTQAASPQLAILKIGAGYGGLDEWKWVIPDEQPSGPGVYGHGAELLPGNIMMTYGGYSISSSGSQQKRQAENTPTFLNLTSMSWSTEYTNPSYDPSRPNNPNDTGGGNGNDNNTGNGNGGGNADAPSTSNDISNSTKKKLGLGLGIGLGIAAILAAILIYFCYRRRLRHRRTIRNSQLQALAQDTSRFIPDDDGEMMERSGAGGAFPWYTGGHDAYGRGPSIGYETLRSGRGSMDHGMINRDPFWGDIPSSQPKRKPLPLSAARIGARGQYQQAPGGPFDAPSSAGARDIHPIYEADEDDGDIGSGLMSPVRDNQHDSAHPTDPFQTPPHERPISFPRAAQSPSPDRLRRKSATDPEVQDWMTDVDAADALLSGRLPAPPNARHSSPTRRGTVKSNKSLGGYAADDDSRTGSNISESNRSNLSGGVGRSGSGRGPRNGFGVAALATATALAEGRGDTPNSTSSSSGAPSYNTARTSFHAPSFNALQAEGPSLLTGASSGDNRNSTANYDDENDFDWEPSSPSKSKPPRRISRGWLGSLRRVFSGPTPGSGSGSGSGEESDRNMADPFLGGNRDSYYATSDYDARLGGLGSIAAGGLLRRKGGRGAWAEDGDQGGRSAADGYFGSSSSKEPQQQQAEASGTSRRPEDDDEWDIEKAIEKRLVQVMFTVPKERLRVVNAEPDLDGGESAVLVDPDDETDVSEEERRRRSVMVPGENLETERHVSATRDAETTSRGKEPETYASRMAREEDDDDDNASELEKEIDLLSRELEHSRERANDEHRQKQRQSQQDSSSSSQAPPTTMSSMNPATTTTATTIISPPTPPASAPRLRGGGGSSFMDSYDFGALDSSSSPSLSTKPSAASLASSQQSGGERGRRFRKQAQQQRYDKLVHLRRRSKSSLGDRDALSSAGPFTDDEDDRLGVGAFDDEGMSDLVSEGDPFFSAKEMHMERPRRRTKVLEMVDQYETKSNDGGSGASSPVKGPGSAASSPVRGSPRRLV